MKFQEEYDEEMEIEIQDVEPRQRMTNVAQTILETYLSGESKSNELAKLFISLKHDLTKAGGKK